jgi:plasmid replication initiation protein
VNKLLADVNDIVEDKNALMVEYRREMNDIGFHDLSEREMKLYVAIIARIKRKGDTTVTLSYTELKKLMGIDPKTSRRKFGALADELTIKLAKNTNIIRDKNGDLYAFHLFDIVNKISEGKMHVIVNPVFSYFLNNLEDGWGYMMFQLEEFENIRGHYAQMLYKKLYQYASTGWVVFSTEEFRKYFEVPDSFQSYNITQKVITPALEELRKIRKFRNLDVMAKKDGKKICSYFFVWTERGRKHVTEAFAS